MNVELDFNAHLGVILKKRKNMVSLTGGLGNQLFQLAFILNQSPVDPLVLERNFGQPRENNQNNPEICSFVLPERVTLTPKKEIKLFIKKVVNFSMRIAISANRRPNSVHLRPLQLIASLIVSVYLGEYRQIMSPIGIGYSHLRRTKFSRMYVGYFQSYIWANSVLEELKGLKIANPSRTLREYIALAGEEEPLVVHVRLGDYVGIDTFGILSKNYYREGISKQKELAEYKKIWLFSNDPKNALEFIPDIYRENVRVIPEIADSPAETMELMRHGKGYVIGNSTYSWWGAFLCYAQSPIVVAPTPWFKGEPSPHKLIPPSWLKVEAFQ